MPFRSLRKLLEPRATVFSAWTGTPSVQLATALAVADWPVVTIDMQHAQVPHSAMTGMVRAIVGAGRPAIVRVPVGDGGMIGRALDAGASGIICPMVNTPGDAQWLASAAKYPPIGSRSFAPSPVCSIFGLSAAEYLTGANRETITWAMIESRSALDALDDILEIAGIDGVFVGPRDLAVSLSEGANDDVNAPRAREGAALIAKKAIAAGAFAGIYAGTPELARDYRKMGFHFIPMSNDGAIVGLGTKALIASASAD